ncbi:MAG: hypothetical protein LBB80_07075 [Treponema sp.]|jgi:hypothetical protein|nr:hypothetical protein [Treponema sp.]
MRSYVLLRRVTLFGSLLFLVTRGAAPQEPSLEEVLPALKERAVVLDITARVVEKNQQEVWNSFNSKVTIPGKPVSLKLVGTNILVVVQFTPYLRGDGNNLLVAQGQIWVDIPNRGIHYQTTIQTIPLEFGEQIYFFPLGSVDSQDEAHIEIQLELHPYVQNPKELTDTKEAPPSKELSPDTAPPASSPGAVVPVKPVGPENSP